MYDCPVYPISKMKTQIMNPITTVENSVMKQTIEIAIRLGVLFIVIAWCLQILMPFVSLIVWAGIIAVGMHTPFLKLVDKLNGRTKLAATVFVIGGIG